MKKLVFVLLVITHISCVDTELAEATQLNNEASDALESENYQLTLEKAKKALDIFVKEGDTLGRTKSLYLIARASALTGDFEKTLQFGEEAGQLSRLLGNFQLEHQINNTTNWAYWALGTDISKIMSLQERQLFVVNQIDDDTAKARAYNNYGYDATVLGSIPLDSALIYSKFANDHYAKVENNNGRWYTLMNLTWQYRLKNDMKSSEHYGKLSAQQAKADNDRHAIIEANANLGETLLYQSKIQEAAPLYEEALKWSIQEEDRDKYVFDVYYSNYLWQKGEKEEAIKIVKNAIKFLETSEVFYEMLGRAFLIDYSHGINDLTEMKNQLKVFENPRSDYFPLEARTIAKINKAKLLSQGNQEEGKKELEALSAKLQEMGAEQLLIEVQKL